MDQADLQLQLKVWKELAIGKQILMRTACDALGIDPDSSAEVLKATLDAAIKRSIEADVNIKETQEHAQIAIGIMEKKVALSERAQMLSEAAKEGALAGQRKIELMIIALREAQEKELTTIKAQLAEKDKFVKAINKTLADTPENVLKKLKTLKKQKDEESEARKLVSNEVVSLRKEKRTQEQRVMTLKAAVEQGGKLAEQHRALHAYCETTYEQLKPLVEDAQSLAAPPVLDEKLLEGIELAAKNEEK